ncbi:putative methyltransferase [Calothrix sp. NIES-4071]|nr:putative methyltransferase [Calothrix sp. NIES-4071]BAZ60091.1 putative methyltransferase [Calothrix sp. NIES-4105]
MESNEYEHLYKQEVINFFNSRTSYDNDYTMRRALPLLEQIELQKQHVVLDVATGTGIIGIAVAQIVGDKGKVIGVDFSSGMLAQARQKIEDLDLKNIQLIEADAEYIEFSKETFDVILCSTAIVYFRDIPYALRKWYSWLKKGGCIGFSCCSEESCEAPLISSVCAKYGIFVSNINELTGTPEKCREILDEAGFVDIQIQSQQFGFYKTLEQAQQWNGQVFHPKENPLLQVPLEELEKLKTQYKREIQNKATEQGVWYENLTYFITARKV